MTLGNMIYQVFQRTPEIAGTEELNYGSVLQSINEALQDTYAEAVAANPEWYMKSASIAAGATYTVPTDFRSAVAIENPDAFFGSVRILDPRTAETVNANMVQQGVAADPVGVLTGNVFEFTPSLTSTSTLWYLWGFGMITDPTVEITDPSGAGLALIPSIFEEDVVLNAQRSIRMRFSNDQNAPDITTESVAKMTEALQKLEAERTPDLLYGMDTQKPAILQTSAPRE